MTLTLQNWIDTGLVPVTSLQAWHSADSITGVADGGVVSSVPDNSGNSRTLTVSANKPTLDLDALNGNPSVVFSGSNNPLHYAGAINVQHFFVVAAYADPTFAASYPGLLNDISGTNQVFTGTPATANFADQSAIFGAYTYRKNNVVYPNAAMPAPISGNISVLEVILPSSIPAYANWAGLDVGSATAVGGTGWKGPWLEQLIYNVALTEPQRRSVHLYFNLKYGTGSLGLPLYFPDPTMTGILYEHFDNMPRDWGSVTQSYEYEDRGRTFNRITDNPRNEWSLDLIGGLSANQTALFDAFWDLVGIDVPFTFVDKFGVSWTDVRVMSYSRSHDKHQWNNRRVSFQLVKYP